MKDTPDPFETLGLTPGFDVSDADIEAAYLARVAGAHPDAAKTPSVDPARLNDARAMLLDPERRAGALLARLGGPAASEDKSLPDGFLFEMMETRTEIEEAIASGGDAERAEWEVWADDRRAEFIARISRLFAEAGDGTDPAPLAQIRTQLNAWRYIERLIEQLDPDYSPRHADFD